MHNLNQLNSYIMLFELPWTLIQRRQGMQWLTLVYSYVDINIGDSVKECLPLSIKDILLWWLHQALL